MRIRAGNYQLTFRPLATVIVIVTVIVLTRLGVWQLQRADEKRMRLEQIAQQAKFSPMSLSEVESFIGNKQDLPVQMTLDFDPQKVFLLDNRIHQGRVGFQLIQVGKEVNTGKRLLVNLGWIQGTGYRDSLPDIAPIAGERLVRGAIWQPQLGYALADDQYGESWPTVIQQVNVNKMSTHYGQTLLSYGVLLDEEVEYGFVRNWQPVVMPPEKHQAYAWQWFLLAVCTLVVAFFAAAKRDNNNNNVKRDE